MRRFVAVAGLALAGAGCAGRARPVGPQDAGMNAEQPPAAVKGDSSEVKVSPPPAVERAGPRSPSLPAGIVADDFDIALQYNGQVADWLQNFGRDRATFTTWLERMSRYEPFIRQELKRAGLPQDLIYLALIESGFLPGATSSAHAVGIWQFMPGTARLEGLEVSTYVDERRDPIRATEAAVHHLRSLYRELGSWYLVAAAYNSGSGRVARALDTLAGGARGADSLFWRIEGALPAETRDYVPKFLAAAIMGRYPSRFGIDPRTLPGPDDFDVVKIGRATDLAAIARAAHTSVERIARLNPQLYRGVTPPRRTVAVRVPAGEGDHLLARLSAIPLRERIHDLHHSVEAGETPRGVAKRFGVSLAALRRANHLGAKTKRLARGRDLLIPLGPARRTAVAAATRRRANRLADDGSYRVRPGDTLTGIAATHGITLERLCQLNDVAPADVIRPGQTLRLSSHRSVLYRVRAGDTLWGIAAKHGVSVEQLRDWNGLSADAVIHPGDQVEVRAEP